MTRKSILPAIIFAIAVPFLLASGGDGAWLSKVPERDRARRNPFENDPNAIAAGAKLFRQNCAKCHGSAADGRDNHPNLQTERIRRATPGELEWLLTNGSLRNGMPSWSRLPEQQRWQLVSFLKSLDKGR